MKEIIIRGVPEYIKEFMTKPNDVNKRVTYFQGMNTSYDVSSILIKDDGVIHYSQATGKVMLKKDSYYTTHLNKRGFTFDGKDLRFWFKGSIDQINVNNFLEAMGMSIDSVYLPYITKTILRDILKKKIECTGIDILKAYFKVCRLPKECVAPLFLKLENHKNNHPKFWSNCPTKHYLGMANEYSTSLYDFITNYELNFNEMLDTARTLNEKVDFSLAQEQLMKEYRKMKNRLAKYEIKVI